jgi:predicted DNA-binding transcriptional regulator AlpA/GNAT superfamily N-acetyltransferase
MHDPRVLLVPRFEVKRFRPDQLRWAAGTIIGGISVGGRWAPEHGRGGRGRRRSQSAGAINDPDIATSAQLARELGVTRAAITNWAARHPDFPKRIDSPSASVMYRRSEVLAWLDRRQQAQREARERQAQAEREKRERRERREQLGLLRPGQSRPAEVNPPTEGRDPDDEVYAADIARELGVRPSAVSNWAARHPDFPKPIDYRNGRAVYSRRAVREWFERRRNPGGAQDDTAPERGEESGGEQPRRALLDTLSSAPESFGAESPGLRQWATDHLQYSDPAGERSEIRSTYVSGTGSFRIGGITGDFYIDEQWAGSWSIQLKTNGEELRAEVDGISVRDQFRGRGIARRWVERLEVVLRDEGVEEITLLDSSRGFWERMGYRRRPDGVTSKRLTGDGRATNRTDP